MSRTSHHDREDLIDAAAALVGRDGFEGLSVRRLAAEVNASRQVVYTHFDGMAGVLDALHQRASRLLVDDIAKLDDAPGTDDFVRASAHGYVAAARARPALFDLNFAHPVAGFEPSEESQQLGRRVFLVHIVAIVSDWEAANLNKPDGQAEAPQPSSGYSAATIQRARGFWSAVHGLVTLERAGHASVAETNALVDDVVDTMLTGWRHQTQPTS